MPVGLRREIIAGGAAGFVGGLVFWLAVLGLGMTPTIAGLLGLKLSGGWFLLHLMAATLAAAVFGAFSSYQPLGYAASISTGLLYGLFWWIVGPLTLEPLFFGDGPTWTVDEASAAFPSVFGHLLFGGLIGFGFYIGLTLYNRTHHETTVVEDETPITSIVILGGGFGGVQAAIGARAALDSTHEVTIVDRNRVTHLCGMNPLLIVGDRETDKTGRSPHRICPLLLPAALATCRACHRQPGPRCRALRS